MLIDHLDLLDTSEGLGHPPVRLHRALAVRSGCALLDTCTALQRSDFGAEHVEQGDEGVDLPGTSRDRISADMSRRVRLAPLRVRRLKMLLATSCT